MNVPRSFFRAEDASESALGLLVAFVEQRGGGLVLLGGLVFSVWWGAGGTGPIVAVLVRDPSSPLNLTVRPVDFPPGTFPDMWPGQAVSVFGIFHWQDLNTDARVDPGEAMLDIRHGTMDKIVIEA
jgi:hypothetical protein